jgi:signal transduction histidine kinase
VVVGFSLVPPETARPLAAVVLPLVGSWAAGWIVHASRSLSGRERLAWTFGGATVAAFTVGQGILAWYTLVGQPVPVWGLPDLFFLSGFAALLTCLLLQPQAAQKPYERVRLILDMTAGVIALFVLLWVTTLSTLASSVSWSDARTVGDLTYAVVDGLVLAGVMVVVIRPARYRLDPRLILGAAALAASSAVDVINLGTVGVVEAGDPLSALWLVGFGLASLLAGIVGSPPDRLADREHTQRRRTGMIAAYGAVLGVVGILVHDLIVGPVNSDRAVVGAGVVVLGALTVARQAAAIRENRLLVEDARDRLISSVSHELRTPLTIAIGFTEILRTRADSLAAVERQEIFDLTSRSLDQLSRLVSDLLMVQRGHLDPRTLKLFPIRADELAERAVSTLDDYLVDSVEVDVASDLKAQTDADRAVQVLAAMLDNALKYGRPPVRLRAYERGGMVVFEVHDGGPGVSGRHQDEMWEAFERGAHRLDAQLPGTGLGLTTVRALTQALGGSVGYRRSPDLGGACFEISLPLV